MPCIVLLVALGVVSNAAASEPAPLTFEEIVQRAAADPVWLAREAELRRFERELAATGRFAREGPTLGADAGPRRMEDGARKLEASVRLEVPIQSGGRARADADSRLKSAGSDILAAESVESRLRLRAAYLDAWFGQERLKLLDAQARTVEQLVTSVRKRAEEGAEAPYEVALVEGEMQRAQSDSDGARAALGDAWSALRSLADLSPEPQTLASPGMPDLRVPDAIESRFEAGLLRRAVAQRGSLETAFVDLDLAQRRSRWSAAATIAKEANESYATLGAAYRFPRRGENDSWGRERETTAAAIDRGSAVDGSRLATRFDTVVERARRFGPITSPIEFEDALRAVALRMDLGKERPSLALPVRRQLLEAQRAALQRIRDAHLLIAEIGALTAGEAP